MEIDEDKHEQVVKNYKNMHAPIRKNKTEQKTKKHKAVGKIRKIYYHNKTLMWFLAIIIMLLAAYCAKSANFCFYNANKIEFHKIRADVLSEIVGQNEAVHIVLNALETTEYGKSSVKVLPFLGATGVGKTFLTNILKRHYKTGCFNVDKKQLQNLLVKDELFKNLNTCSSNLVVVDNLGPENVKNAVNFAKSIPTGEHKVLLILVFNTHVVDENLTYSVNADNVNSITAHFEQSHLNYDVVAFKEVSVDDLRTWIMKELDTNTNTNRQSSSVTRREEIANTVIGNHDLTQGFKGLQAKLILERQ